MGHREQEREFLKTCYPSKRWRDKVNAMSDSQVSAVYLRLQRDPKNRRRTKS